MIAPQDYDCLKDVLHTTSGHALGEGKEYLIERRLSPVAETLGHPDLGSLLRELRIRRDARTVKLVCEAMTTNESLFFRDGRPFDLMRTRVLPDLLARRASTRKLRIWSAACSTGQEAFSLAMTLAEFGPDLDGWDIEIVGTDYSPSVIARARTGVFNHFEVQRGLPVGLLLKYFEPQDNDWRAKSEILDRVSFREGNLRGSFASLGSFDVVFCRNVLIYFDADGKRDVLDRLTAVVPDDGYLFLGAAETALGVTEQWSVVPDASTTLFQRKTGSPQSVQPPQLRRATV